MVFRYVDILCFAFACPYRFIFANQSQTFRGAEIIDYARVRTLLILIEFMRIGNDTSFNLHHATRSTPRNHRHHACYLYLFRFNACHRKWYKTMETKQPRVFVCENDKLNFRKRIPRHLNEHYAHYLWRGYHAVTQYHFTDFKRFRYRVYRRLRRSYDKKSKHQGKELKK